MSFDVSIVSNGLQLENLAQAQPTMEQLWERLLQVRTSHRYHMRFSDACSSSRSPPVAATGFVAPGSAPFPCHLSHRPHTSTGAFPRPLAYSEVSSISLFSVQWLTTQRSCPSSPRLCNDFGSISLKYVHYTDTACASLMLVIPSTVHARRKPACSTLDVPLAAFLTAPRLHGRIPKAFGIPRCKYDII